jgi:hypothetical protein
VGRSLKDEQRAEFKRYKEDVKSDGKPFFPYAIFHDTVMAFVTVVVIIGLAAVWYYTADGVEAGILGPWYAPEADPGTIDFIPRPDWFFYFLFYLLRVFKWPESVVLGTVGIPTILLILLLTLPFYDRRRERRLSRRLDGDADLEGRNREGGARLGADRGGDGRRVGGEAGLRRGSGRGRRWQALRAVRLPELPRLPR